jgi:prepilin-type N-terminal cleavage/methylation domain-containing protein
MAKITTKNFGSQSGFTLIEMLIVITILGILTGVIVSTINQQAQRQRAQDAVNTSSMEQTAQGLESYFATEGVYPAAVAGATPNMSDTRVTAYLAKWPTGFKYVVSNDFTQFEVYVAASNGTYLKYDSSWGKIKMCKATQVATLGVCTDSGY